MSSERLLNATCPECRGPLHEVDEAGQVEFECLVGHRYSPEGLLNGHYEAEERALWAAVVALQEAPNLVNAVSQHMPPDLAHDLPRVAEQKLEQAEQVRKLLEELKPFRTG